MEIEVKRTIYIDLDEIIEESGLTKASGDFEILSAVRDYAVGLDDCDYYAINSAEYIVKIVEAIAKKLKAEPTAKEWEDFWNDK